jgi:hypothetical protein
MARIYLPLRALSLTIGLITFSSLSSFGRPDPTVKMPKSSIDNVMQALSTELRQTGTSPSTISIEVTNRHSSPVTILTWNSPLDPLALQLGLLSLTPAGAEEPLTLPTIQVSRKMPPNKDSLVTLQPGESKRHQVELREAVISNGVLFATEGKAKVVCKGEWTAVWPKEARQLDEKTLQALGTDGLAFKGVFNSNVLQLEN